ncbi:MAG: lipid-A-disaccharide synthase, partial [Gammaproteobacteria bacterium]|nr:lipid-A-disaccharide synthase [Gammaproteobacteria bacterium]
GIAREMKAAGIPTVHYVSPTVWAWRSGRARTVAASADMLLSIFPFEAQYYENLPVDYRFVGHYVADEIEPDQDRAAARAELGIDASATLLAVLPGSRAQEHAHHCADFAATAGLVRQARPDLEVVWSALDERGKETIGRLLADQPGAESVRIVSGMTRTVLAAADAALVVSGTVTLEALLLRCPFVAAYRTSPWTYRIARRLVRVPHIAMANILAGKRLVPEFLQDEVRPAAMSRALLDWLDSPERAAAFRAEAGALHLALRRNASGEAANAVLELAAARGCMPT